MQRSKGKRSSGDNGVEENSNKKQAGFEGQVETTEPQSLGLLLLLLEGKGSVQGTKNI